MATDMSKSTEARKPLNPHYVAMPFIFKNTGEVKRCKRAGRFTRKLSLMATSLAKKLQGAKSLTITGNETTYILSPRQTAMLMGDESHLEAIILQGWIVEETSVFNLSYIPSEVYEQTEMDMGE